MTLGQDFKIEMENCRHVRVYSNFDMNIVSINLLFIIGLVLYLFVACCNCGIIISIYASYSPTGTFIIFQEIVEREISNFQPRFSPYIQSVSCTLERLIFERKAQKFSPACQGSSFYKPKTKYLG